MAKKKTTSAATLAAPGGTAVLPATGVVTPPPPAPRQIQRGPRGWHGGRCCWTSAPMPQYATTPNRFAVALWPCSSLSASLYWPNCLPLRLTR